MDLEAQNPSSKSWLMLAESILMICFQIGVVVVERGQLNWVPLDATSVIPHTLLLIGINYFMSDVLLLSLGALGSPMPTKENRRMILVGGVYAIGAVLSVHLLNWALDRHVAEVCVNV